MLRRGASSLLSLRAAWHRRLPRPPVTPAAGLSPHPPEACARLRLPAPIPQPGARAYARMARRIPPARPDGYSTSDGEDVGDGHGNDGVNEEDLEQGVGEEGTEEVKEWEGYMLDFGSGSDEDDDAAAASEEEEKK